MDTHPPNSFWNCRKLCGETGSTGPQERTSFGLIRLMHSCDGAAIWARSGRLGWGLEFGDSLDGESKSFVP